MRKVEYVLVVIILGFSFILGLLALLLTTGRFFILGNFARIKKEWGLFNREKWKL